MPTPELSTEPVTVAENGLLLRVGALVHNDPADPCHWRIDAIERDAWGKGVLIISPVNEAAKAFTKAPYNQPWYGVTSADCVIEVGTELGRIE